MTEQRSVAKSVALGVSAAMLGFMIFSGLGSFLGAETTESRCRGYSYVVESCTVMDVWVGASVGAFVGGIIGLLFVMMLAAGSRRRDQGKTHSQPKPPHLPPLPATLREKEAESRKD